MPDILSAVVSAIIPTLLSTAVSSGVSAVSQHQQHVEANKEARYKQAMTQELYKRAAFPNAERVAANEADNRAALGQARLTAGLELPPG